MRGTLHLTPAEDLKWMLALADAARPRRCRRSASKRSQLDDEDVRARRATSRTRCSPARSSSTRSALLDGLQRGEAECRAASRLSHAVVPRADRLDLPRARRGQRPELRAVRRMDHDLARARSRRSARRARPPLLPARTDRRRSTTSRAGPSSRCPTRGSALAAREARARAPRRLLLRRGDRRSAARDARCSRCPRSTS